MEAERGSRVADGEVDPITGEPFTEMSGEGCKSSADGEPGHQEVGGSVCLVFCVAGVVAATVEPCLQYNMFVYK